MRFAPRRGADIRLELRQGALPSTRGLELLFDSGGLWRVYRLKSDLLYVLREKGLPYEALVIDEDRRRGTLFVDPERIHGRFALDYPLDELLFQHRLALEGGAEIHACGVVLRSKVLLFCGHSGAGKTTIARLWKKTRRGVQILSDDRVMVRHRHGRLWAHGTPWHGSGRFAMPGGFPLGAVFFLSHAQRTSLSPLTPPNAASWLFARSFPPLWDARAIGRVLELCDRAASLAPSYDLRFRPDRSALSAVLAVI